MIFTQIHNGLIISAIAFAVVNSISSIFQLEILANIIPQIYFPCMCIIFLCKWHHHIYTPTYVYSHFQGKHINDIQEEPPLKRLHLMLLLCGVRGNCCIRIMSRYHGILTLLGPTCVLHVSHVTIYFVTLLTKQILNTMMYLRVFIIYHIIDNI